jgi:hypothetical protein
MVTMRFATKTRVMALPKSALRLVNQASE